jgi:hypothetical protein
MNKLGLSLNLMPSFYHKHLGVNYGEGYYFDPGYRSEIEKQEQLFLYEILGKYGEGSKHPTSSTNLMIQPVDLIMATQGAKVVCPDDATLETWGNPWSGLSIEEIKRIDPEEAAHHQIIDQIICQYREMEKMYGKPADIFGIKAGNMSIHAPYTTAHQLCSEDLFCRMMDSPEDIKTILMKIWQIYQAVFERLQKILDAPVPHQLNMGDCSACMLSQDLYHDLVLPVNCEITREFQKVKYHSCGGSTHLLNDFTAIPRLEIIELGPGTDFSEGVRLMPEVEMRPLVDPVPVRNNSPAQITELMENIISATSPAPQTLICAWSLDRETPIGNLEAICSTVNKYQG